MRLPLSIPFNNLTNLSSRQGYSIRPIYRWLLVCWTIFLIAGFALAIYLKPSPSGYGTHQQLGLPPCSFYMFLNVPCPSCGMTTSFSHFVRGDIQSAAEANFAGLLLAVFCLLQIPWAVISIFLGRLWFVNHPDNTFMWILIVLVVVCLLQWVIRLI